MVIALTNKFIIAVTSLFHCQSIIVPRSHQCVFSQSLCDNGVYGIFEGKLMISLDFMLTPYFIPRLATAALTRVPELSIEVSYVNMFEVSNASLLSFT